MAPVLAGMQGHFSEPDAIPLCLPLSRSIRCIMQACLPFRRQQEGRFASASGANSGAISDQPNIIKSESAIVRRIGFTNCIVTLISKRKMHSYLKCDANRIQGRRNLEGKKASRHANNAWREAVGPTTFC